MNRIHQVWLGPCWPCSFRRSAHIGTWNQKRRPLLRHSIPIATCLARIPDTPSPIGSERMASNRRERERFFNTDDWNFELDFDGDCQSTRQEVLILTSRVPVRYTNPRNCVVRTGEWVDEYTGEVFEVAMRLDIDHVIPLMYAHTHGGDRWSPQAKLQFANDPLNIMMVDRREIRRKRDRGPSRYLPREEFQCEYVRLWDAIAEKYDLFIENRDRNAMDDILENCTD